MSPDETSREGMARQADAPRGCARLHVIIRAAKLRRVACRSHALAESSRPSFRVRAVAGGVEAAAVVERDVRHETLRHTRSDLVRAGRRDRAETTAWTTAAVRAPAVTHPPQ